MALATPGSTPRPSHPGAAWRGRPPEMQRDFAAEHMLVNIGPQHPATHGVLRLVLELDGETVVRCIPHIGYLHSGFEKLGEYRHYNQIIPLTDRTDYLSPMANNVALALAAEKLMGIEITERCTVLRVIALLERPQERRERADVDAGRAEPDQVRDDPRQLAGTRSTLQRSVISIPNSRSAPSAKATLLPRR